MKKETISALISIVILSFFWLYINRNQSQISFYVFDFPYFLIFTGAIFTIGIPSISQGIRYGTKSALTDAVVFPFVLLILYSIYLTLHHQPVVEGASLLIPYLVLFPVLALYQRPKNYKYVSWWDFVVLLLFLWPITILDLPERSSLPVDGVGFDSIFRMMMIIIVIYAFVVVRRLPDVGFWINPSWRKLWTTFWVWGIYFGFVVVLGFNMKFIVFEGFGAGHSGHWEELCIRFLSIFLHTALFEELFFRGLLQNMLSKKIRQSSNPLIFWFVGSLVMLVLAGVTGILMQDGLIWFPGAITLILFLVAYLLSNFFKGYQHHYLGMAITSVFFGLVHFHTGSVVFVGFAILAGWAYGYVYWKTRNVFYAALIHTLVNFSPVLLGLQLMK